MDPPQANKAAKKLIVACDGTWMNSDNGFERQTYLPWDTNGTLQTPSNVTRICRALLPESHDGTQQIIYYQAGIGTESTFWNHVVGGGTGAGLSENIREAYAFLATNYDAGDEIYLIGFSRAFTARSIGGFIDCMGLLTRPGMEDFYSIFKDWENQDKKHYKSKWPDSPFPNRPNAADPAYAETLEKLGSTRRNITIKAIGVWDTVGALGIPAIGFLRPHHQEYSFVNTRVSNNVEYAFQALALDEHRKPFSPTIWERPNGPAKLKELKQVWFPGVHSNIGGSYDDTSMADITLTWMISQLTPFLDFHPTYIAYLHTLNKAYYASHHLPPRHWSTGKIYNSATGIQLLAGSKVRTPGRYREYSSSGEDRGRLLEDTKEYVHASVRFRMGLGGLGTEDRGLYKPEALNGWMLHKVGKGDGGGEVGLGVWGGGGGRKVQLMEDELGEVELELLRESPAAARFLAESR
ncbi:hypothetical protein G7Y79_00102g101510 [Physcia stellaris]|nr:hypothetical protein G7Y79_00102g101510 [Physcia stellaris]